MFQQIFTKAQRFFKNIAIFRLICLFLKKQFLKTISTETLKFLFTNIKQETNSFFFLKELF